MICVLAAAAAMAQADSTLPNGALLRVVPVADSKVVSVQAFVRLGSVDDPKPGAAHLLEHMLFRRNLSADRKAEAAGGELNATTYREFMRFEFRGPSSSVATGISCVAQLLEPPQFADLATERRIVAEEVAIRTTSVDEATSMRLWSVGARGTPYEVPPIGLANSLESITEGMLVDLYRKYFVGHGIVLVIVGDVDSKEVLATIEKAFKHHPKLAPPALVEFRGNPVAEQNTWAIPVAGIRKLKGYAAALVVADLLAPLSPEVKCEFGLSAAGSLFVIRGEPGGVVKLRTLLSRQVEASAVKEAALRLVPRIQKPTDVSTAGMLHGFGLLFGKADLQRQLIDAIQTLLQQDVQKVVDEFASVIGK